LNDTAVCRIARDSVDWSKSAAAPSVGAGACFLSVSFSIVCGGFSLDASPLLWVVPISGVIAVLVAAYFAWDVLRSDTGTPEMQKVAGAIYTAAVAFIKRQYRTIALLADLGYPI